MASSVVLIVANPFEARLVSRAVEGHDLRAVVSEGGEGVVEKLDEARPQVVVLAQGLYYADEREVLALLRERAPAVPVLLIWDGRTRDPRLIVDEVLGRPINPTLLVEKLAQLKARPAAPAETVETSTWWEETPLPKPAPATASELAEPEGEAAEAAGPPAAAAATENTAGDDAWWVMEESPPPANETAPAPAIAPAPPPATETAADADAIVQAPVVEAAATPSPASVVVVEPAVRAPSERRAPLPSLGDVLGPAAAGRDRSGPARPSGPEGNASRVAALLSAVTGTAQPLANPGGVVVRPTVRRDAKSGRIVIGEPAEAPAPPPDFPESGDLESESLPVLLVRLHRAGFAGRLTLRRGEGEKSIYFDGGFPVHATSNLPHDRLGELLRREGRVTRDQHARSRQIAESSGRRIVEVLIELSALRRDEIFKVLRHHAEEIIYSAFGWERGAWQIGRELASLDERVSIGHPYAIAMEGIRRKYGLERLVQAVGPTERAFAAAPLLYSMSADAQLSSSERDALQLLRRGPKTVAELQVAGRLDRIGAYALVHGLLVIGGLVPSTAEAARTGETGEGGEEVDRERALAKYELVLEGDYFAVLGVQRTASGYEIRRAWERARSDFAPERFEPKVRAELGEKLVEILEVLDEAWRTLGDEALRESYRAALPS